MLKEVLDRLDLKLCTKPELLSAFALSFYNLSRNALHLQEVLPPWSDLSGIQRARLRGLFVPMFAKAIEIATTKD